MSGISQNLECNSVCVLHSPTHWTVDSGVSFFVSLFNFYIFVKNSLSVVTFETLVDRLPFYVGTSIVKTSISVGILDYACMYWPF